MFKEGDRFFFRNDDYLDDIELFVCKVDDRREQITVITDNPLPKEMSFDTAGFNKWRKSSLRRYLNEDFVNRLGCDGHLVPMAIQMDYCYDFIVIPAVGTKPIPQYDRTIWTMSYDAKDDCHVYTLDTMLNRAGRAGCDTKRAVAPLFKMDLVNLHTKEENGKIIAYYEDLSEC